MRTVLYIGTVLTVMTFTSAVCISEPEEVNRSNREGWWTQVNTTNPNGRTADHLCRRQRMRRAIARPTASSPSRSNGPRPPYLLHTVSMCCIGWEGGPYERGTPVHVLYRTPSSLSRSNGSRPPHEKPMQQIYNTCKVYTIYAQAIQHMYTVYNRWGGR